MKRTEIPLLGLAISALSLQPGQTRTHFELQCYCDAAAEVLGDKNQAMSDRRFQQIETKALRKLRIRLCEDRNEDIRDAALELCRK